MNEHMSDIDFRNLKAGDEVRHNVSGKIYRVSSVISPFFPRFRRVMPSGKLSKEVRSFLNLHLVKL